MKFNGKKVVKLVGRISAGKGTVSFQYEDGTIQTVSLEEFRASVKKGE